MRAVSMRVQTFLIAPPRNPLLRALWFIAAVMIAVVVAIAGLALAIGTAVVAASLIMLRRGLPRRDPRQTDPDVIDGEFTVLPPRGRQ